MKRAILPCLLTALLTIPVRAAQPPPEVQPESQPASPAGAADEGAVSAETPPYVTEPVLPKRDLVFGEQSEPLEMTLFAADPKLLEQRYVAVFRLLFPFPSGKGYSALSNDIEDLYEASIVLSPRSREAFEEVVGGVPPGRLPSADIVSALTAEAGRHLQRSGGTDFATESLRYFIVDYKVLAPTAERARELTEGLLSLYDHGLSYPIQQSFLRLRQERERLLPEKRAELEKARQGAADVQEQLKRLDEFADLGEQALTNLTTQRRLIAVDLAGVQARIDACSEILATAKTAGYASQVEILQVTAQIELVGLKAKESYINAIVEKGRERQELSHKGRAAQMIVRRSEDRVSSVEASMAEYEAERKRFMPFRVEGGRIAVHAIRWQPAAEGRSP